MEGSCKTLECINLDGMNSKRKKLNGTDLEFKIFIFVKI